MSEYYNIDDAISEMSSTSKGKVIEICNKLKVHAATPVTDVLYMLHAIEPENYEEERLLKNAILELTGYLLTNRQYMSPSNTCKVYRVSETTWAIGDQGIELPYSVCYVLETITDYYDSLYDLPENGYMEDEDEDEDCSDTCCPDCDYCRCPDCAYCGCCEDGYHQLNFDDLEDSSEECNTENPESVSNTDETRIYYSNLDPHFQKYFSSIYKAGFNYICFVTDISAEWMEDEGDEGCWIAIHDHDNSDNWEEDWGYLIAPYELATYMNSIISDKCSYRIEIKPTYLAIRSIRPKYIRPKYFD